MENDADEKTKEKITKNLSFALIHEKFGYEMFGFWSYIGDEENMKNSREFLDVVIKNRRNAEKIVKNYEEFLKEKPTND
jgi:hypothetical protein